METSQYCYMQYTTPTEVYACSSMDQHLFTAWPTAGTTVHVCSMLCSLSSLTFHIVVHNVVSVQVGQCLKSAPEDVFGVVHHQLQHGGLLLVLHQEVGESTVAHLGQVALQVTTHARQEVVAEVARGTLGVLLAHHHCLEGEDVVVGQ